MKPKFGLVTEDQRKDLLRRRNGASTPGVSEDDGTVNSTIRQTNVQKNIIE
jgi:hypothetical protein